MSDMSDLPPDRPGLVSPLIITSAVFTASLTAGIIAMMAEPGIGNQVTQLFKDVVAGGINSEPVAGIFISIFVNNLVTNLLIFLGGATFGALSVFILATNGLVIGIITELIRQKQGMMMLAAGLLPHGIFEIPAFLIAGALGFSLAGSMWRELTNSGDAAADAARLSRTFLVTVLPLLLVAAFVEAFITPYLIRLVA